MIKTVILGALGLILAFALSLMYRLGAFKPVELTLSEPTELILLYKEHIGPYHKIVPVIEEVESWAKARDLDCTRSFGEYFDDPRITEDLRLKSRGGCVLQTAPSDLPPDFMTETLPERKYIQARFRGGPSIAPYKVYPKMHDYAHKQRLVIQGSVIEIYEGKSEEDFLTTYLMRFE